MFAQVNDLRMHYTQEGSGDDVLFVHGLGSRTEDWELQIPAFAGKYRVTCVDLRGFGETDKPLGHYSTDGMANDVLAFMETIGLERPHVVGISMGGMVAQWIGILGGPERVRSLTLGCTAAKLRPWGADHFLRLMSRVLTFPFKDMRGIAEHISKELFPEPQQAEWREKCLDRFSRNDLKCFRLAGRACLRHDARAHLPKLGIPTFILVGDEDPLIPIPFSKELHRLIPDSRYMVLPMSRHACFIDQADRFNAAILAYIKDK